MEFIPYTANEYLDDLYYQVPVELFINPIYTNALNSDSKLLYAFLRNRHQLSVRNNQIDENGYIYLIFTRKELQEKLNLSDKTVTKAFKQLVSVKLIYEKKQGNNKPNIIYIGKINHVQDNKNWSRRNYDCGTVNFTTPDTENLRVSNKDFNKKDKYNIGKDQNGFLIKQLAKKENVNEELKAKNQLEWVAKMNNIKNPVEEIIVQELLYQKQAKSMLIFLV